MPILVTPTHTVRLHYIDIAHYLTYLTYLGLPYLPYVELYIEYRQ